MRALGPGSVSSFLKIILDVVFIVLWVAVGALALGVLVTLVASFNPDLVRRVAQAFNMDPSSVGPMMLSVQIAFLLSIVGFLVIVRALRQIFSTLTAGDPFHPDNVQRLRLIGLTLALLELGRYVVWGASRLAPILERREQGLNVTAWFSVLVVFVLAEVFREGARLRREAELTI